MTFKDLMKLFLLAAMWGASFLFIRVGDPSLGPFLLIFLRVFIAAVVLLIFVFLRGQKPRIMHKWKQYLIVGLLNAAVPMVFISIAELQLSASLAAILNATTPLFTAVVAWAWLKEGITTRKLFGLIAGFVGVAILVGWSPTHNVKTLVIYAGFSLVAAISYAIAGVYSARVFKGEKPMNIAIGQQLGASLILLPFAIVTVPRTAPTAMAIGAALVLAILCTAIAYLIYFALIRDIGPVKAISVTFLVPVFGVGWGVLFLGDHIAANVIAGLTIVLLSVVLVTNMPLRRKVVTNRQALVEK